MHPFFSSSFPLDLVHNSVQLFGNDTEIEFHEELEIILEIAYY